MLPHQPAPQQPEDWHDDVLDDLVADEDYLNDEVGREPLNYGEVAYSGIVEGEVDGMWLLSYWTREENLEIKVAVFDRRKAALEMAAQIDELTGTDRIWRVDTVFLDPADAGELIEMLEGTEGDEE
jgi:hypothetical protein